MFKVFGKFFLLSFLISSFAVAEELNLRWTESNLNNAVSYKIRLGLNDGVYTKIINSQIPRINISNVTPNSTIYILISTITSSNTEIFNSSPIKIILPDQPQQNVIDSDGDGIGNGLDNCINIPNFDQLDSNQDGIGDLCQGQGFPTPTQNIVSPTPQATASVAPTGTIIPTPSPINSAPINSTPQATVSNPSPSPTFTPVIVTPTPVIVTPTPVPSSTIIPTPINTTPTPVPTNSNLDTDGDGVSDDEERRLGTDPFDSGDQKAELKNIFCGEWNKFFGMYNYAELRNSSSDNQRVQITAKNSSGDLIRQNEINIRSGAQVDYPIHEMIGSEYLNQYGRVCFSTNADSNSITGQLSYYFKDSETNKFEFAYTSQFTNGQKGDVFLPLNNFNPNLSIEKQSNPVGNWIQITNLNQRKSIGRLIVYDQSGGLISDANGTPVSLEAGERKDLPLHNFGQIVGLARWVPDNKEDEFLVRNARYIYKDRSMTGFDTAFQIDGMKGTGATLSVPLDTTKGSSIIEIINTISEPNQAVITILGEDGAVKRTLFLGENILKGFGSFHLITDTILGQNSRGTAIIRGIKRNSVAAVAMQYARNSQGNVDYMYGVQSQATRKTNLEGSYNTFLNQNSFLAISNPGRTRANVNIKLKRFSGEIIDLGSSLTISNGGSIFIDLSGYEQRDVYGLVDINSNSPVSAWIIREKGDEFAMPTNLL